ncbi:MAG: effector binding domain-containing protein [Legionella longbeachae]|nr:effector binding domain-containing protein [Legionella longbeachae]
MQCIPPTLKHIDSFRVMGLSVITKNRDEFDIKTARLPKLWQEFYSINLATDRNIFGVYSDYASDANGLYTVTVGTTSDHTQNKLSSVTIREGNYLVFHAKGPMPLTVIEAWKSVWDYFSTKNQYQRSYLTDFEVYRNGDTVDIYIGII